MEAAYNRNMPQLRVAYNRERLINKGGLQLNKYSIYLQNRN